MREHYFSAVYAGLTVDEISVITMNDKCAYMAHSHLAYERDDLKTEVERLNQQRDELIRTVEMAYKMLLAEPDTKAALFKAEDLLRGALANVKESKCLPNPTPWTSCTKTWTPWR